VVQSEAFRIGIAPRIRTCADCFSGIFEVMSAQKSLNKSKHCRPAERAQSASLWWNRRIRGFRTSSRLPWLCAGRAIWWIWKVAKCFLIQISLLGAQKRCGAALPTALQGRFVGEPDSRLIAGSGDALSPCAMRKLELESVATNRLGVRWKRSATPLFARPEVKSESETFCHFHIHQSPSAASTMAPLNSSGIHESSCSTHNLATCCAFRGGNALICSMTPVRS